jgi:DNA-binding NarL/FixJ family response regulator
MKSSSAYRILVVDDHQMLRLGLKALTQTNDTLTVQWLEADNLENALELFGKHEEIDLVMLDLNLPDSQGLKSAQSFLSEFPKARIAVYSATEDEFVMRQALALGVIGFIPKSLSGDSMLELLLKLLTRVQSASSQNLSHPLVSKPLAAQGSNLQNLDARDVLTPTQLKVLELLLAGLNNRQIADECHLALGTVKNTVSAIILALNANSRSHLISLFR